MISVRQLMQQKDDQSTYAISPNASVYDALQMMSKANVGAVMVVENNKMVGIFTERDYARKIILKGKTSLETPLREIMTTETITVHPDQTIDECMSLMTKWHIRHLPVMEEGHLIGMVSMRDIVEAIIKAKDSTIESLEKYILSEGYQR